MQSYAGAGNDFSMHQLAGRASRLGTSGPKAVTLPACQRTWIVSLRSSRSFVSMTRQERLDF